MERRRVEWGKSTGSGQQASDPAAGPRPALLRKHSTVLPVNKVHQLEPGRILLISPAPDYERDAVAAAWEEAGGKVCRVEKFWTPDESVRGRSVCVYGNVIFCEVLANVLGLELVGPANDMLLRLPEDLLSRKLVASDLSQIWNLDYPCFVKPMQPKLFTAGVVPTPKRLDEMTVGLEGRTEILVSEVVKFQAEARAFIFDRRVLDCAIYQGRGPLKGAQEVAKQVARLEDVPHGFVVDLGLLNGRWVVIELNPSWGAGLNGCDAGKVYLSIAAGTRA